jgi:SecD/SecF fusion protein
MQGKGIIRFFLFALLAVCLWQYLLYIPTGQVERAARDYAETAAAKVTGDKDFAQKAARVAYLDSISNETVFSIPLLKNYTYQDLKAQQLSLGLDLKGGMSVLMQVDLKEFLKSLSGNNTNEAFNKALNAASDRQKSTQTDYVTLFAEEFAKVSGGQKLAQIFASNEGLRDKINFGTSDGDVTNILREKSKETVGQTYEMLKQRIDKFGVVQPNVSLDAARDMILVELPGIDNPERARKFLQQAAKLEFWNVYRSTDPGVVDGLLQADARLKALASGDTTKIAKKEVKTRKDTSYAYKYDSIGRVKDSTMKIVDKPIDTPQERGPLLSNLNVNPQGGAIIGTVEGNKRNIVMEALNRPEIKAMFSRDLMFRFSKDPIKNSADASKKTTQYELFALKKRAGKDGAPLEGDRITNAQPTSDPSTNQIAVSIRMDNKGARTWGELTSEAAKDQNREIAIVLDDEVVSAPRVINPIMDGSSQITGNYTLQEAKDFSNILQIGKLPAKPRIIQESIIGPSLGEKNINSSLIASVVGILAIMAFMLWYYGSAGIISVIALAINLFLLIGILATYGTVLTLPGIAGIVLTMGAAVDANVIIFERVREELRKGASKLDAIKLGFKHSYSAIIDANVVVMLTSIVMAIYGLGPIKGFAVVLFIGVLTTLFTAVLVSHYMADWWTDKGNDLTFSRPNTESLFTGFNIDWVGMRKKAYMFSIGVMLLGLGAWAMRGFELGVDFKGGYSYNVQFDPSLNLDPDKIRGALAGAFNNESTIVKAVDTRNTFNITTSYLINENDDKTDEKVAQKLYEGLNTIAGGSLKAEAFKKTDGAGTHITSSSKVGATVADDIRSSSWKAILASLLVIGAYIFIRFRYWQYSMGAIVALFHDVFFVLAFFALFHGILPFSMEIDQALIAAILTVVGYSLNDTVIVFDRIREFLNSGVKCTKEELINAAINTTLSRTLITSFNILLVIMILFIFGGSSMRGFAFALLIGIVAGTYSSIFVATPLFVDLTKGELKPIDDFTPSDEPVLKSFTKEETAK